MSAAMRRTTVGWSASRPGRQLISFKAKLELSAKTNTGYSRRPLFIPVMPTATSTWSTSAGDTRRVRNSDLARISSAVRTTVAEKKDRTTKKRLTAAITPAKIRDPPAAEPNPAPLMSAINENPVTPITRGAAKETRTLPGPFQSRWLEPSPPRTGSPTPPPSRAFSPPPPLRHLTNEPRPGARRFGAAPTRSYEFERVIPAWRSTSGDTPIARHAP